MSDGDLNTFLHKTLESACTKHTSVVEDFAVALNEEQDYAGDITDNEDDMPPNNITTCKSKEGELFYSLLLHFALDVCEAMIYLSAKLYVHR